jgi:excisionase family DNA binding protein
VSTDVASKETTGPDKDYLLLNEVAEYLRVSPSHVRKLIAAGRFPEGVQPGGRGPRIWPWLDVVAFLHLETRLESTPREAPIDTPAESSRKKSEKTSGRDSTP